MIQEHDIESIVFLTGSDRREPLPGDFAYLVWDNDCHGIILEVNGKRVTVLWAREPAQFTIHNNVFHNVSCQGITMDSLSGPVTIEGNVFYNNHGDK